MRYLYALRALQLLLAGILVNAVACHAQEVQGGRGRRAQSHNAVPNYLRPDKTPSAMDTLDLNDIKSFEVGREDKAILADIHWRGYQYIASKCNDKTLAAIYYDVRSSPTDVVSGIPVFAIFENGKFNKFVDYYPMPPRVKNRHLEGGGPDAQLRSHPSPTRINSCEFLEVLASRPSLDLDKLIQKSDPRIENRSVDPGLTAAVLTMKAIGIDPTGDVSEDYEENARLRHQFNGARLKIGMSEGEVENLLKSKSIDSGEVSDGSYKLYGKILIEALVHHPSLILG